MVGKPLLLRPGKIIFLLGMVTLLAVGCKTAGNVAGGPLKKRSARFLMKQLVEQQVEAEWFSAKAKISYADAYETVKLSANIRMRKDSLIWMNFKKLSVEAVRMQITPDSIYIIDRLNNQYAIRDFASVQQEFHLPATFDGLQNLLLGNPVFFTTELEAEILGDQYQLSGEANRFANTYLLNGFSYLIEALILEDQTESRIMTATLEDYRELEDAQFFSYFRNISLIDEDNSEVSVSMELSKVEINVPKSINFDIPDRYTRMD
jgi:hypothetical protein